jgi:hypothetical protein
MVPRVGPEPNSTGKDPAITDLPPVARFPGTREVGAGAKWQGTTRRKNQCITLSSDSRRLCMTVF